MRRKPALRLERTAVERRAIHDGLLAQPRADALQPHALDVRTLLVAEDLDDGAVDLLKKADAR